MASAPDSRYVAAMRTLALLALLAPTIAAASPSEVAGELAAAIRAKNTKAVTKVLSPRVYTEGLWFPDAACAKRFAKAQVIEKGQRGVLAGCLAKLALQANTRSSTAIGGAVLTFAPGMELELGTVGKLVYHLSFAHADARPTLTMQAFEALRTKGSLDVDAAVATELAAFTKKTPRIEATLEVCLDAQGKPAIRVAAAPIASTGEVFREAVADWAFSPFVFKKKAMPVCGIVTLFYPAKQAGGTEALPYRHLTSAEELDYVDGEEGGEEGGVEGGIAGGVVGGDPGYPLPPPPPPPPPAPPQNVPPTLLEGQRIAGDKLIVPDEETKKQITKSGKDKVIGSYKLCVDVQGNVTHVNMLKATAFEAYDVKIMRTMRTWKYRPYLVNGQAKPVCTAVTFIYSQK